MSPYRTEEFISREIAQWASGLRYEHLSQSAIDAAKRFWFDSLVCAVGGTHTDDAEILRGHYQSMAQGMEGACSVLFADWKTNPVDAAFLNSHLVRALDFNDIYWQADPAHPSDLICGPLALGELHDRDGRDLIVATVILYELQCRFAEFGRPGIREYGWHHATLSAFASAIGAGWMLELSADQMVHAMGISASRTGTLGAVTAGNLTMMKNTVDPWASRMGVESAMLAQRGFTGPAHVIDGKEGLVHTFGHSAVEGEPCRFKLDVLTDALPSRIEDSYRIERCGMKSFPVEALMHSPLSALFAIVEGTDIDVDSIDTIEVEVIARAADILGDPAKYRPTTRETADHSLPYAIAVSMVDGVLGHAQFSDTRVADDSLHTVMDKVRVLPNASFESRFPESQPSRVTVHLRNGESISREVEYPRGDPRSPMTWQDIEQKLIGLAPEGTGSELIERLGAAANQLDEGISIRSFCQQLSAYPQSACV